MEDNNGSDQLTDESPRELTDLVFSDALEPLDAVGPTANQSVLAPSGLPDLSELEEGEDGEPPIPPERIGAFFDVDQTLVRGASVYWAAKELFRRSFFGFSDLFYAARQTLRYVMFGEDRGNIPSMTSRAAQVIAGRDVEDLQQVGEAIFEQYFVPKVYKGTYDILKDHVAKGHAVYLISATPWLIAEEFAMRIGAAGGIGTKTKVHEGKIVGEVDGDIMHGQAKVEAVLEIVAEKGIDLEASWAYSDSANDIPMLSLVGHPVAVNPDRTLRAYAKVNGWTVFKAYEKKDLVRRGFTRLALGASGAAVGYGLWRAGRSGSRRLRDGKRS